MKWVGMILLALALAGCAKFQSFERSLSLAGQATVDPQYVRVAVNVFDALEATATRCRKDLKICRNPTVWGKVRSAVLAGRKARNALEDFYTAHPGQLGPKGLYDSLVAASDTIQDLFGQYKIGA